MLLTFDALVFPSVTPFKLTRASVCLAPGCELCETHRATIEISPSAGILMELQKGGTLQVIWEYDGIQVKTDMRWKSFMLCVLLGFKSEFILTKTSVFKGGLSSA